MLIDFESKGEIMTSYQNWIIWASNARTRVDIALSVRARVGR